MRIVLQRMRGIAVSALTWTAAWTALGAIFRVVWPTEAGLGLPTLRMIAGTGISWALPGFVAGAAFALLLTLDRRRRLEDWSMKALALRGAVGAATIPLFALIDQSSITGRSYVGVLPVIAQYAVAGGLCAVSSFLLARRAPSVATVELQG